MKALKMFWFWLTRYLVVISWEGKQVMHWAKSEGECIEWLQQYPYTAMAMYGKRGRVIGSRWSNC